MKLKEAIKIQTDSAKRRLEIRKKKAHDYATEDDVLSNFKRSSIILSTYAIDLGKPSGVALMYALLKIDRLSNLIYRKGGVQPSNESIMDTLDDLENYIDLMIECLTEEGSLSKS